VVAARVLLIFQVVMDITRFGDSKMRLMVFALIFTTLGKYCRQLFTDLLFFRQ